MTAGTNGHTSQWPQDRMASGRNGFINWLLDPVASSSNGAPAQWSIAGMATSDQNAKNVHAPLFREKIPHRTRQDARHVRPLASAIPIFNHRSHLMKTAVIALTMLFFATPALPADREPCIVQFHSAIAPTLIVVTVECKPIATEVSLYHNEALIQKITLPPPLNQRGDPLYFIVSPVPGINSFYAASNDVLPENDGTLSQPPQ